MRAPVQAKALLCVALQLDVRVWGAAGVETAVLGPVVDEDPAVDAQGSDHVRVLGLVTGLVDLTGMVDLLDDVHLDGSRLAAVTANLATILIVVIGVRLGRLWDLDLGNLEVVVGAGRGVSADQKAMHAIVLVLGLLDVRKPLGGQSRPVKSSAQDHVVEEGAVLLPRLVLYRLG